MDRAINAKVESKQAPKDRPRPSRTLQPPPPPPDPTLPLRNGPFPMEPKIGEWGFRSCLEQHIIRI